MATLLTEYVRRVGPTRVGYISAVAVAVLAAASLIPVHAFGGDKPLENFWLNCLVSFSINVVAGGFIATLGLYLWHVSQAELLSDFDIVIFNYKDPPTGHTEEQLHHDINQIRRRETHGRGLDPALLPDFASSADALQESVAEHITARRSGNIMVIPFSELCLGVMKVLSGSPHSHHWALRRASQIEADRSILLGITYEIFKNPDEWSRFGIRCFLNPERDIWAAVRFIRRVKKTNERVVLLAVKPSEPTEARWSSNTRNYVSHVEDYLHENFSREFLPVGGADRFPQPDDPFTLVVASPVPHSALCSELQKLCGLPGCRRVLVPPTWLRDWKLDAAAHLGDVWGKTFGAVRVFTVVPDGILKWSGAANEAGRSLRRTAPKDVLEHFQVLAYRVALQVQLRMKGQKGVAHDKTSFRLRELVSEVIVADHANGTADKNDPAALMVGLDGNLFYECAVVQFELGQSAEGRSILSAYEYYPSADAQTA